MKLLPTPINRPLPIELTRHVSSSCFVRLLLAFLVVAPTQEGCTTHEFFSANFSARTLAAIARPTEPYVDGTAVHCFAVDLCHRSKYLDMLHRILELWAARAKSELLPRPIYPPVEMATAVADESTAQVTVAGAAATEATAAGPAATDATATDVAAADATASETTVTQVILAEAMVAVTTDAVATAAPVMEPEASVVEGTLAVRVVAAASPASTGSDHETKKRKGYSPPSPASRDESRKRACMLTQRRQITT